MHGSRVTRSDVLLVVDRTGRAISSLSLYRNFFEFFTKHFVQLVGVGNAHFQIVDCHVFETTRVDWSSFFFARVRGMTS